jgi:hypothetical protein
VRNEGRPGVYQAREVAGEDAQGRKFGIAVAGEIVADLDGDTAAAEIGDQGRLARGIARFEEAGFALQDGWSEHLASTEADLRPGAKLLCQAQAAFVVVAIGENRDDRFPVGSRGGRIEEAPQYGGPAPKGTFFETKDDAGHGMFDSPERSGLANVTRRAPAPSRPAMASSSSSPASSSPLRIRAGRRASAILAERGLDPDAFATMVGASGGPKWLALARMDLVLAERFLARRSRPLAMVGSSIGSFRHACLAQSDPRAALARFEEAYLAQVYETAPTPEEVTAQSLTILAALLGSEGPREILAHPLLQTHIVTARSRWTTASTSSIGLGLGLAAAALANAASRSWLDPFFERVVFHSGGDAALAFGGLATRTVGLTAGNLLDALAASGSIPLVMAPIIDPQGAPTGVYRDGGIVDYHFDFTFRRPDGLVLYPHFFDRITPGWFDKSLSWRRPSPADLDDTVLLAPSPAFVAGLPGAQVPDRRDFETLPTAERLGRWRRVLAETEALADDLAGLFEGPIDPARILPFD